MNLLAEMDWVKVIGAIAAGLVLVIGAVASAIKTIRNAIGPAVAAATQTAIDQNTKEHNLTSNKLDDSRTEIVEKLDKIGVHMAKQDKAIKTLNDGHDTLVEMMSQIEAKLPNRGNTSRASTPVSKVSKGN